MNNSIFITVRTGSTRLPSKALLQVGNKSTIECLIDRVKRSSHKDNIVLCTTELPEDDILCELARKNEILFCRGSTEDKLERWLKACNEYSVDFFVTADGDDLFCDPELIDKAFEQYRNTGADFIQATGIVCGAFTYGIKAEALRKVCEIKDTTDTEMMWVYFTDTGMFNIEELKNVDPIYYRDDIRMTLDYADDLEFFRTIIEHFGDKGFSLGDIIQYLDDNPKIKDINFYLHEEWSQNQKDKTRLAIR